MQQDECALKKIDEQNIFLSSATAKLQVAVQGLRFLKPLTFDDLEAAGKAKAKCQHGEIYLFIRSANIPRAAEVVAEWLHLPRGAMTVKEWRMGCCEANAFG